MSPDDSGERRTSYDERLDKIEQRLENIERVVNRGMGGLGLLVVVINIIVVLFESGHLR